MKQVVGLLCVLLFALSDNTPANASLLNAPHNGFNQISCINCHEFPMTPPYAGWSAKYGYVDGGSIDNTIANFLCLRCHDGTTAAPAKGMHSSLAIMGKYLNWTTQCIDCHDPHFQSQLKWKDTQSLFLLSGTISSKTYFPTSGVTTVLVSNLTVAAGWDNAALWYAKSGTGRGLIFVSNKNTPKATYEITSATYNATNKTGSIMVAGEVTEPDATQFGVIYGQMIKNRIRYNSGYSSVDANVTFFNPNGGFIDPVSTLPNDPPTGICQVCHTKTTRFKNTGAMPTATDSHNAYVSRDCMDCHTTSPAFKASGNQTPTLTIAQPDGVGDTVTVGAVFNITYSLADPDNVVTAAFYFDTDNIGLNGTAIAGACAAAPEGANVSCAWNTSGMTPGTYYVYGITTDGVSPPVSRYSPGMITINAPNQAPTLTIAQPDGVGDTVTVGAVFNITYSLADPDNVVTAAFYFDTDNIGLNGTAIAGACAAAPEGANVSCAWNTSGMTPGTYYVYGITTDGVNPQVSRYSPGMITINAPNQAPTLTIAQPDGVGDTVTTGAVFNITYSLADPDNIVTAAFYFDTDNIGLNGTAIAGACAAAPEGTNVSCAWDTSGMPPGTYYVYGITTDGVNPQVSRYSSGPITIMNIISGGSLIYVVDQWTVLSSGTSATFPASSGSRRLVMVAVHYEYAASTTPTLAVAYGGKALTRIGQSNNLRDDVWVGYLKETDIAGRIGDAVTVSFSTAPTSYTIAAATYGGVDQITPVHGAVINFSPNATSSSNPTFSGLPVVANGYAMYNLTADKTVTLTPPASYTEHYDQVDGTVNFNIGSGSMAISTDGTETRTIIMNSKRWGLVATSLKPSP